MKIKKDKAYGVIIYRKKDDKTLFLIIKHSKGHWAFPKGHRNGGETKLEAALRELYEETQIYNPVLIKEKVLIKENYIIKDKTPYVNKTVEYFIGKTKKENIKIDNKEIIRYGWFNYKSALQRVTFQAGKKTLKTANELINYEK